KKSPNAAHAPHYATTGSNPDVARWRMLMPWPEQASPPSAEGGSPSCMPPSGSRRTTSAAASGRRSRFGQPASRPTRTALPPPPADWDVGHFVNLAALARGPAADLVVVRDTYQELGLAGHHLQPPDRVAAALRRDDGHEGGVLAVLAAAAARALRERLERGGF